jgi:hypothetical protein
LKKISLLFLFLTLTFVVLSQQRAFIITSFGAKPDLKLPVEEDKGIKVQ